MCFLCWRNRMCIWTPLSVHTHSFFLSVSFLVLMTQATTLWSGEIPLEQRNILLTFALTSALYDSPPAYYQVAQELNVGQRSLWLHSRGKKCIFVSLTLNWSLVLHRRSSGRKGLTLTKATPNSGCCLREMKAVDGDPIRFVNPPGSIHFIGQLLVKQKHDAQH